MPKTKMTGRKFIMATPYGADAPVEGNSRNADRFWFGAAAL
jgi:hypothetical protein